MTETWKQKMEHGPELIEQIKKAMPTAERTVDVIKLQVS
jgi:hypothetical protein